MASVPTCLCGRSTAGEREGTGTIITLMYTVIVIMRNKGLIIGFAGRKDNELIFAIQSYIPYNIRCVFCEVSRAFTFSLLHKGVQNKHMWRT